MKVRPIRDPKAVKADIERELVHIRKLELEIEDRRNAIEMTDKRILELGDELAALRSGWNGL